MLYVPTTPSIKSVIRDNQIKLPRFQRKKTWNEKKRFELCISMFMGYPLGTIVIRKSVKGNKVTKQLLDGRQRRDTLQEMQNPESIYLWAKKYMDLKNRMDETEIRDIFDEKMKEFIQYDEDEYYTSEQETSEQEESEEEGNNNDSDAEEITISPGLDGLVDIICAVHPLSGKTSSFNSHFLFKDYPNAPYCSQDNSGKRYVDTNQLLIWIRSHIEADDIDVDNITVEQIANWYERPEDVKNSVKKHFKGIKNSLKIVQTISNMMDNVSIQMIELDENCKSADARKIFEIINSQGVPLTSAEILSAKPDWNNVVVSPRQIVIDSAKKMYESLDATFEDVVKWDVCATFTDRLVAESDFILGKTREIKYDSEPKQFEKKITFGFKLMSSRFAKSVAKDDIDKLPNNENVDWNGSTFEDEIEGISSTLLSDPAFKRFNYYHTSINECLGSTIALNYLILCVMKWTDLGKPKVAGAKYREFILSCRILFDKFIYEYATNQWKGSSDSRLNKNLTNNYPDVFNSIDNESWSKLIDDAFESNIIGGQNISTTTLKALTYYFTMLRNVKFDLDPTDLLHIDHIIPASKFTAQQDSKFKDSLYNYALLPPDLNQRKSDNTLDRLDPVDYVDVCKYESLDETTAKSLKTPADLETLKTMRKPLIQTIKDLRLEFVDGTGEWLLK